MSPLVPALAFLALAVLLLGALTVAVWPEGRGEPRYVEQRRQAEGGAGRLLRGERGRP